MSARPRLQRLIRSALLTIAAALMVVSALVLGLQLKTSLGAAAVEREWQSTRFAAVRNLGATTRLEITRL